MCFTPTRVSVFAARAVGLSDPFSQSSTGCPKRATTKPTRMSSSTAATVVATNVAVRQGRTSASLVEAEDSTARRSLRRACLRLLPGLTKAARERHLGTPAELSPRERRVEHAPPGIAGSGLAVGRLPVDACDLATLLVQPVDGGLDAGPDVEDSLAVLRGREDRCDDIRDIDEVAALLAVSEDQRLLARGHPLEEDRDHAALERG